MTPDRPRLGAAALVLGLVAVASYAGQRLGAAWLAPQDLSQVIAQAHTPYYWRCAVALLHGVVAGALAGVALDERAAARLLARGAALVAVVVIPCAAAMVLVP